MLKIAYLLAPGHAQYTGKVTHARYNFTPWAEVDEADWEEMRGRVLHVRGCCSKPARQMRVFGSEEEIRQGLVGFNNR